jgi:hypothetical protein
MSTTWLPVYNATAETIPPFAVVVPTGVQTDTGAFAVAKCAADGEPRALICDRNSIPPGATGVATADNAVIAAYSTEDDAPAAGDTWGPAADEWVLRLGNDGFRAQPGAGSGVGNFVRISPPGPAGREPSWAVRTSQGTPTVYQGSAKVRQLNGSFAWVDGSTLTNRTYPVEIGGAVFVPVPDANGLLFPDPVQANRYDFVPFQYADKVSTTYYGGMLSPSTQQIAGAKTWHDAATFESTIDVDGVATFGDYIDVTGRIEGASFLRLSETHTPSGDTSIIGLYGVTEFISQVSYGAGHNGVGWQLNLTHSGDEFQAVFGLDADGDVRVTATGDPEDDLDHGALYVGFNPPGGGDPATGGYGLITYLTDPPTKTRGGTAVTGGLTFAGGLYISGTVPPPHPAHPSRQ